MATNVLNLVCIYTDVILKTLLLRDGPGKTNTLRFLDGQAEEIDPLQGPDHVFDQRTKLSEGHPVLVLGLASQTPWS